MIPDPDATMIPEPDGGVGGPGEPSPTLRTTSMVPPDQPAVGHVVAGDRQVYVYSDPSTASQIVAALVNGEAVFITCTTRGESVPSPSTGGSSDLWNYTTLGGFIPDVVVDTGTDEPVKPECAD
jgi:hypothetical protein